VATSGFSLSSLPYPLQITNLKIGIAIAEWNNHITFPLRDSAIDMLKKFGIDSNQTAILQVPGAFELPYGAQLLFEAGCDAVICLGCVIKGDTPHFEYVCQGATEGIMRVGLDYEKPCIFGVLTTLTEKQALSRAGGALGNKGAEAAVTALSMISGKQYLNSIN